MNPIDDEHERPMFGVKTTRNLGDESVKRVNMEPHVSGIQCGETPTYRSGQRQVPIHVKVKSSLGRRLMSTDMLQFRTIAMAYRLE